MRADWLRILGWVIPIFCMVVAGWILFKENHEFTLTAAALNNAHRDNETAAQEFQAMERKPAGPRFAAADDLPQEEISFLTYLRTSCAADHVNFKSWVSVTVEYGKDKETSTKDPKIDALLKGIRKISAAITLLGTYQDLRKLVGEMETSDRLYTLSNLTWTAQKEGTQLIVSVSRYVSPAKPSAKKALAKPDAKGAPSTPAAKRKIGITESTTPPPAQPGTPSGITTKP